MKLIGKIAIVTGASRGIGRATALAFAREGADVVLAARTEGDLKSAAQEIKALGRTGIPVVVDVSKANQVQAMVKRALNDLGTIDVLVNAAGVGFFCKVEETPLEIWDRTFAVNMRGTFLCCKHVLPCMMRQKRGSIISVASGARGHAGLAAYHASKFGVVGFTQALAEEVQRHNIAVNCVRFGRAVNTRTGRDIHAGEDRRDWLKPEDVTDILVVLGTQDASGVTGAYVNTTEWQKQIRGPVASAETPVPHDLKAKMSIG